MAEENQPDADSAVPTPKPVGAVFISYASQDAEAAKRICGALRAAGIEIWFDQSELRGGDVWDRQIRQQIHDCRLFVPIVSANTEARVEGYFRREWKLAVDRTHDLSERVAFLVPIVIDSTSETKADVPEAFRHVQWTRLPGGNASPEFVKRIRQLVMPVLPSAPPADTAHPEYSSAQKPTAKYGPRRAARLALWVLSGVLSLGLVYFVADELWLPKRIPAARVVSDVAPAPTPAMPAIPEKSVAVLPFVDMSEKKDQEYFSDGLSEELIDLLTKVPQLRVPARTSSFYFKGKQTTTAEISRALSVANILEGSVRKSGNTLRITAQLVRADTGYHVWSETYDRKFDEIFKIQDEIADAVVKALKISLLETATPRSAPTTSTEAYTLYAQARALTLHSNPTDAAIAADYLRRAIELDPNYALAWAHLTQIRTFQYEMGSLSFEKAREEATRSAQRAVELDPNLAAAHLSMARVHRFFEWNWGAVGDEIQRARKLDPGDSDAVRWAGVYALFMGNLAGAIDLFQQAVGMDPLDGANYSMLGAANFDSGNYAAAEHAWRKAVELAPPRGFGANGGRARVLLATGRAADALTAFEQFEDEGEREWGKALAYFALGRKAESDGAVENLERKFADTGAYGIAEIHANRGEFDQAFRWLDHAYRQHDRGLASIKVDFWITPLRGDPRFKAFLRKMNL